MIGLRPLILHSFLTVVANLNGKIGMGMPIVPISPFRFLEKLDKDLPIHPGLGSEFSLVITLEVKALFVVLIGERLLKILHEKTNDLLGPLLHTLDVKVNLSANLMLGNLVLFRGVGIGVVRGTAVAAGNNDPLACLLLDEVEQVDKDGIDVLLAAEDGKTVAARAVGKGSASGVNERRVNGVALTPEKVLGNARKIRLRFPRIGRTGGVEGGSEGIGEISLIAIDRLPLAIKPPDLFPLRLLHTRTGEKK